MLTIAALSFFGLKKQWKRLEEKLACWSIGVFWLLFFFCARNKIIKNQVPSHGKEKHKRLDWATCLWARHNSNRSLIFSDFKSDLSWVVLFTESWSMGTDCWYEAASIPLEITNQSVRKNNLWYQRRFPSYLITDQCVILANVAFRFHLTK